MPRSSWLGGFCIYCAFLLGACAYVSEPRFSGREEVQLISVVDGDTIRVARDGENVAIRLIGIDTPESSRNQKAIKDAKRSRQDLSLITEWGKRATRYTRSLVPPGSRLWLEFDVQQRDRYGRLLAYVFNEHGGMLNEKLVREGYATVLTYPPNVKYQERFSRAYEKARSERRGLWTEH